MAFGGALMEISVLYHQDHAVEASEICRSLVLSGYQVFAGPRKLDGYDTLSTPHSYLRRSLTASILLMSLRFYRQHQKHLEQFVTELNAERANLQIISMDGDWQAIPASDIETLKAISFFQELERDADIDEKRALAQRVSDRILGSLAKPSHLTSARFEHFLRATYDPVETFADVNEAAGQIAFTIYDCVHTGSLETERYLVLYHSASFSMTKEYLDSNFPGFGANCDKLFVVRSDPIRELSLKQKENVSVLFGGIPKRFETLVNSRKLRRAAPRRLLLPGDFLTDQDWYSTHTDQKMITSEELLDRCAYDDLSAAGQRRITILSGEGGAGKTHTSRFLHDKLVDAGRNVFFLSASDVGEAGTDLTINSLYDIYRCSCAAEGTSNLVSRELFDLKFLVNDPVVIVDGLEEIITMIGDRFDLNRFYDDCVEKISGDANGRIIITTRQSGRPEHIEEFVSEYLLEPFTQEQAKNFFEKAFAGDGAKVSLAMQIHRALTTKEKLPPLICEIIRNEIRQSEDLGDIQAQIDNDVYQSVTGIESFLRAVIGREDKLGTKWPPDETLKILAIVAKECVSGPLDLDIAVELMSEVHPIGTPSNLSESVKNFIFFKHDPNTNSVSFRYDFLRTIFLAEFVFDSIVNLKIEELETPENAGIYGRLLFPGSDILSRILARPKENIPDGLFTIIEEMIKDIKSGLLRTRNTKQAQIVSSNLFFLRLALDAEVVDIRDTTKILKRVFSSEDGRLEGVSLLKFSQDPKRSFQFDVSGCTLVDSIFDGTSIDQALRVDSSTEFVGCVFRNCIRQKTNNQLWFASFTSIREEDRAFEIERVARKEKIEVSFERKEEELKRFFRLFASGQHFAKNQSIVKLNAMFTAHLGKSPEQMVSFLMENGLVEPSSSSSNHRDSFHILPGRRIEVRQFVLDGITSRSLSTLINKL